MRAKTRPVPSAKAVAATVKKQVASALKIAKSLVENTAVPANSVSVGAEGAQGVSYFGFLPENLTVPGRYDRALLHAAALDRGAHRDVRARRRR